MVNTKESSATVLVAAEDGVVARCISMAGGHRIVKATSCETVLESFDRERPDLLVVDTTMPSLDGLSLCRRLRSMQNGAPSILALVSPLDDDGYDRALAAGADEILVKPVRSEELETRVGTLLRLARAVARNREHDALQRRRDELTALIIHDLKTPLAAMNLESEFALESELPPDVHASLLGIRESIGSMRRMIMDLLDVSRAETGELVLHRSPVDLREMVDRIASSLRRTLAGKSQSLELRVEPGTVDLDGDLFRRVLENLVDNACRCTRQGGHIVIAAKRRRGSYRVEVADQGPGIPPEARDRVFEKYFQLDEQRHRHSRGLGLTFCKLAVEAHGGHIWVADNGRVGARFCIDLAA